MVSEIRRQFRKISGIMTGDAKPDYGRCVMIATSAAQHEMIMPSMIAVLSPIIVAVIFGVAGVLGLLGGALSTGFVLALFLSNSGGAWDNAKKYVESGAFLLHFLYLNYIYLRK